MLERINGRKVRGVPDRSLRRAPIRSVPMLNGEKVGPPAPVAVAGPAQHTVDSTEIPAPEELCIHRVRSRPEPGPSTARRDRAHSSS